ncbi:hypothetical protein WN944_016948 [Citrus x changshan-huyou]|uniref:Uncharacterized protein n=1 Tax=Citrus x changshan-huyou TaxID=2935761 RepID=A0AAP0QSK1_9ROSI
MSFKPTRVINIAVHLKASSSKRCVYLLYPLTKTVAESENSKFGNRIMKVEEAQVVNDLDSYYWKLTDDIIYRMKRL